MPMTERIHNPYLECGWPKCKREPVVYVWLPLNLPSDHPRKVMVGLCERHESLEAGSEMEGKIFMAAMRRERKSCT